jgi:predicted class III extradiol MEMO1 family dioxygenase
MTEGAWETPLGKFQIETSLAAELAKNSHSGLKTAEILPKTIPSSFNFLS